MKSVRMRFNQLICMTAGNFLILIFFPESCLTSDSPWWLIPEIRPVCRNDPISFVHVINAAPYTRRTSLSITCRYLSILTGTECDIRRLLWWDLIKYNRVWDGNGSRMNASEQQECKDRKKRLIFSLGIALMSLNCSVNGYSRIIKPTSAPLLQTH